MRYAATENIKFYILPVVLKNISTNYKPSLCSKFITQILVAVKIRKSSSPPWYFESLGNTFLVTGVDAGDTIRQQQDMQLTVRPQRCMPLNQDSFTKWTLILSYYFWFCSVLHT